MVMFRVQPGRGFHSVQEVVSADKPRLSISGWYHKAAPQQGSEHASLQQLQMKAGEDQIQQHAEFEGACKLMLLLACVRKNRLVSGRASLVLLWACATFQLARAGACPAPVYAVKQADVR
eukprot:GHRQ01030252.1.p1 GENE.GHRQ01030252.1~~GHRQ01030252.1.p1  ORF type:complete len:120 (+),score=43.62 GHRQ01030252.1:500-859(+)